MALIGGVIGVPIGVALGQALWRNLARSLGVVVVVRIPWVLILLAALGGLVVLAGLAVYPVRRVAGTRPPRSGRSSHSESSRGVVPQRQPPAGGRSRCRRCVSELAPACAAIEAPRDSAAMTDTGCAAAHGGRGSDRARGNACSATTTR